MTLKLEGYEPCTFALRDEFNVVSMLNLGGILGWGVDIATGAVTEYSPASYSMDLEEENFSGFSKTSRAATCFLLRRGQSSSRTRRWVCVSFSENEASTLHLGWLLRGLPCGIRCKTVFRGLFA